MEPVHPRQVFCRVQCTTPSCPTLQAAASPALPVPLAESICQPEIAMPCHAASAMF